MLLVAVLLACFGIYYQTVIRRSGRLTANSIFVYLNTIMAVGSVVLLETTIKADTRYGWIITYTLIAYMLASGVLIFSQPRPPSPSERAQVVVSVPGIGFWGMAWLSLVVVILYFREVGSVPSPLGCRPSLEAERPTSRLCAWNFTLAPLSFPWLCEPVQTLSCLPAAFSLSRTGKERHAEAATIHHSDLGCRDAFRPLGTGQRGALLSSRQ